MSGRLKGLQIILVGAFPLSPYSVIESKTGLPHTSGTGSFSWLVKQASPSVVNISFGFIKKTEEYRTDQTVLLLVDRGGTTLFITIRIWSSKKKIPMIFTLPKWRRMSAKRFGLQLSNLPHGDPCSSVKEERIHICSFSQSILTC